MDSTIFCKGSSQSKPVVDGDVLHRPLARLPNEKAALVCRFCCTNFGLHTPDAIALSKAPHMETTYVHKTALGALLDSSEIGTIGLVIFVYTVVGMLNHSPPFCLPPSLTLPLPLSSQSVSEDLMGFVKDLWRQNSSLVDAFEKSKKRQLTEKKRMKQELVSLMNQIHHQGSSAPTNEVDFNDQPSIINTA